MEITSEHRHWAKNKQRRYGKTQQFYLDLIVSVKGKEGTCAFSEVPLLFDAKSGTPQMGGRGCHPLYASLDHASPGSDQGGLQIVSYALNDVKGHLPLVCFRDLVDRPSWRALMKKWRKQARKDPADRKAFYAILKGKRNEQ